MNEVNYTFIKPRLSDFIIPRTWLVLLCEMAAECNYEGIDGNCGDWVGLIGRRAGMGNIWARLILTWWCITSSLGIRYEATNAPDLKRIR
jgi:hypothetical protein